MNNNDSWTPEEIARANERQKEISEAAELKKVHLELKSKDTNPIFMGLIWFIAFATTVAIAFSFGTNVKNEYAHLMSVFGSENVWFYFFVILFTFAPVILLKQLMNFSWNVVIITTITIITPITIFCFIVSYIIANFHLAGG